MILKYAGKSEYVALKLMAWGTFLQSAVFDKIYLPGPWELSLVHSKKLI